MLEKGISVPTVLYTYTPGGSVLNQSFLWRVPDNFSVQDSLSLNQRVVSKLNDDMPIYHTRAMRQEFVYHNGFLCKEQSFMSYELYTVN